MDTPKTKDPRKPVEYYGKEASRFTASLLKGQQVRLEIQTSPTSRDRYGRLLAYVFRQSDNLLVNKEIIRQGYGHATRSIPSTRPGWRNSEQRNDQPGTETRPLGIRRSSVTCRTSEASQ